MNKILIALICMLAPAMCMASDFNYDDDDTKIDVSDQDWDEPGTNVDVDFSGDVTGINDVFTGAPLQNARKVSFYGNEYLIAVNGNSITVDAAKQALIPVYKFEASSLRMVSLIKGRNTISLDSGTYLILGKKYRL